MSPSSLEKLPVEILLRITEILHLEVVAATTTGRSTLRSLAFCSKRLLEITTPSLYRTFTFTTQKMLPLFIRSLLLHPKLQTHVKIIHGIKSHYSTAPISLQSLGVPELLCKQAFGTKALTSNNSDAPFVRRWQAALDRGEWDALFALLLSLTKNLEVLVLKDYPKAIARGYTGDILRRSLSAHTPTVDYSITNLSGADAMHRMPILSCLTVAVITQDQSYKLRHVLPLLIIPTMDCLIIRGLTIVKSLEVETALASLPNWVDRTSPIKVLQLQKCAICDDNLLGFFQLFTRVEQLYYNHDVCSRGYVTFTYKRFTDAIEALSSTLQSLELAHLTKTSGCGYMGSLKNFTKLTTLKMSGRLIVPLGDDLNALSLGLMVQDREFLDTDDLTETPLTGMLPQSIQKLDLLSIRNGNDNSLVLHMLALLKYGRHAVPNLGYIAASFEAITAGIGRIKTSDLNRLKTCLEELENVCRDLGVECDLRSAWAKILGGTA